MCCRRMNILFTERRMKFRKKDGHLGELKKLVSQNQAESYIHFMGWADMTEVYKNY